MKGSGGRYAERTADRILTTISEIPSRWSILRGWAFAVMTVRPIPRTEVQELQGPMRSRRRQLVEQALDQARFYARPGLTSSTPGRRAR
jgi:hypothetical protein